MVVRQLLGLRTGRIKCSGHGIVFLVLLVSLSGSLVILAECGCLQRVDVDGRWQMVH